MNIKNLPQEVLNVVNSSNRRAPAHFTSNGQRTQSFCVDFDISEKDEYEMASEAWYQAKEPSIVKTGEDVMLASYVAVKLGCEEHIPELLIVIYTHNQLLVSNLESHRQYLQKCSEFAVKLSNTLNS